MKMKTAVGDCGGAHFGRVAQHVRRIVRPKALPGREGLFPPGFAAHDGSCI
jgi:hypothetical protein